MLLRASASNRTVQHRLRGSECWQCHSWSVDFILNIIYIYIIALLLQELQLQTTLFCIFRLNAMESSGVVLFGTPEAAQVHAAFQQLGLFWIQDTMIHKAFVALSASWGLQLSCDGPCLRPFQADLWHHLLSVVSPNHSSCFLAEDVPTAIAFACGFGYIIEQNPLHPSWHIHGIDYAAGCLRFLVLLMQSQICMHSFDHRLRLHVHCHIVILSALLIQGRAFVRSFSGLSMFVAVLTPDFTIGPWTRPQSSVGPRSGPSRARGSGIVDRCRVSH